MGLEIDTPEELISWRAYAAAALETTAAQAALLADELLEEERKRTVWIAQFNLARSQGATATSVAQFKAAMAAMETHEYQNGTMGEKRIEMLERLVGA